MRSIVLSFHEALFWDIRDELEIALPGYKNQCESGGRFEMVEVAISRAQTLTLDTQTRRLADLQHSLERSNDRVHALEAESTRLRVQLNRYTDKYRAHQKPVLPIEKELERVKNQRDAALRACWAMSDPLDEVDVDNPVNGESMPPKTRKPKNK